LAHHKIKSWSHFFQAIADGKKKHDLRKNDRNYQVGDSIMLLEYDNIAGEFTGREQEVDISYITSNRYPCAYSSAVLPNDYCILSLEL
jgi:hypothetical protein